jgi:hypothetical protein
VEGAVSDDLHHATRGLSELEAKRHAAAKSKSATSQTD